ncbi:LLM class flavin-dependent oxidoreductase [Pseudonocardia eucalypti]|uniref:LLM class flavin-dependent oxidoreductase n=1 Tax=Pseudonocardia eucalypti TaxID=648755 RepID=A0ABP9PM66_9PSEU|nr:alkanesulfonate monooxygenase SsuD/methylene tetrahydromethanopterin reductase-like flavin-dependent oxidoreductase (luciferase family) [Pseudonocardia eucalypti]
MIRFGMPWPGTDVAREAEQAGVGAFCTGDFVDHDAYVTLAEMAAGTERALIGPAITYAFSRTPYAHATAMRQLHAKAPGRLFLGLGTAAFRINRDWLGVPADHPVDRAAETVEAVRAWLRAENGDKIRYSGRFHSVDADVRAPVLGRLDIPVLLAAFNRRMAAAAGRVADGVIGHGLFTSSWWREVVRPAARQGAAGDARTEQGWIITAIDDTAPERAVADARRMIAFYLTVKTYDPFVAHHGWEAPVARLRAAFRSGDTDGMAAAVTDQMLTEIAICGTTADAKDLLARRTDGLPRDVGYFAPPSFLVGRKRRAAYARSSLALLGAVPA